MLIYEKGKFSWCYITFLLHKLTLRAVRILRIFLQGNPPDRRPVVLEQFRVVVVDTEYLRALTGISFKGPGHWRLPPCGPRAFQYTIISRVVTSANYASSRTRAGDRNCLSRDVPTHLSSCTIATPADCLLLSYFQTFLPHSKTAVLQVSQAVLFICSTYLLE